MSKKHHKPKRRPWIYMILVLVLLAVVLYLGRGWIRKTFEPAVVSITAGRSVQATLDKEMTELNDPFAILGISKTQRSKDCRLSYAHNFTSEVDCQASVTGYSVLPAGLKTSLAARAKSLETTLKRAGWKGGNTSISELGGNIAKGIDYTPDAAYMKKAGDITCLLDFNTAFSRPKPAAINGSVSCFKSYDFFGTPPQVIIPG